jgi:hypothetical protein
VLIPAKAGIQEQLAPSPGFVTLGPRLRGDERIKGAHSTSSEPALSSDPQTAAS